MHELKHQHFEEMAGANTSLQATNIMNTRKYEVKTPDVTIQVSPDRPDLVEKLVLAVTLSRNNEIVRSVITRWIDLTVREDWNALVHDMAENMYSDAYVRRYRPLMPLLALLQKPKPAEPVGQQGKQQICQKRQGKHQNMGPEQSFFHRHKERPPKINGFFLSIPQLGPKRIK